MRPSGLAVAVVGGGWSGLAAAVEATRRGHAVTLLEMAAHWGGRARSVAADG
jgi:protoporphyrinogen oxidase